MGVENVRLEVQQRQRVQRAPAEEAEPLVFISAQAVDIGPAKVILVVHEVPGNAVHLQLFNAAILTAPAQLYLKVAHMGQLFRPFLRNGTVQGQQYPHIVALRGQHGRQRAHHVRQTTGFYKGHTLGCRKEDFHGEALLVVMMKKGRRDAILFSPFWLLHQMTTFFAITMG